MSWENGIQISIVGASFLFAYIAFNIDTEDGIENQFLRLLFLSFSIIFAFASIGANFGILDATGIVFTDSSKLMSSLRSVYIPFIIFMVLLLFYVGWIIVKRIIDQTKRSANIANGETEDDD